MIFVLNVGLSCCGWIVNVFDYFVFYSVGLIFDLMIGVDLGSDMMFVVNDLNGNWFCNDDGGEGFNLLFCFDNLFFGCYDIWVGVYFCDEYVNLILFIFEVGIVVFYVDVL